MAITMILDHDRASTGQDVLAMARRALDALCPRRDRVRVPPLDLSTARRFATGIRELDASFLLPGVARAALTADERRRVESLLGEYWLPQHPALSTTVLMAIPVVERWWGDERVALHVDAMTRLNEVWVQLFSESDAGSDLTAMRTSARLVGGAWMLTGRKAWSTAADVADYGICIARTHPGRPTRSAFTAFALDLRAPGVSVNPIRQMNGLADFNEVVLDDVRVSDDARLGEPGDGWSVVTFMLNLERNNLGEFGSSVADVDLAAVFVERAARRGLPISAPLRSRLIDLVVRQRILALTTERLRTQPGASSSLLKLSIGRLTADVADIAAALEGAAATAWASSAGMPVTTFELLDAPKYSIAGGTSQIQRNVLAEHVLGLPREPQASKQ